MNPEIRDLLSRMKNWQLNIFGAHFYEIDALLLQLNQNVTKDCLLTNRLLYIKLLQKQLDPLDKDLPVKASLMSLCKKFVKISQLLAWRCE